MGSTTNSGVTTDHRVHALKQQVLRLVQLWADSFMLDELRVPQIHESYRALRKKGYTFPARGPRIEQSLTAPPPTPPDEGQVAPVTDKQVTFRSLPYADFTAAEGG